MQESGVPNVSGSIYVAPRGWYWPESNGCFYNVGGGSGEGRVFGDYQSYIYGLNSNRSSLEYQSINEVRVKSIISIGFIKLY